MAQALALDNAGNVYVTGASMSSSAGWDYATVKYDSNGNQKWVARYNGAGQDDSAAAIAVDATGNVYVTGSSKNSGGHFTSVTIKYSATGSQVWLSRYTGPGGDDLSNFNTGLLNKVNQ